MLLKQHEYHAVNELINQKQQPLDVTPAPDALVLWRGAISFLVECAKETTIGKRLWIDQFLSKVTALDETMDRLRQRWLDDGSFVTDHAEWYVCYLDETAVDTPPSAMDMHSIRSNVNKFTAKHKLPQVI